jgi:membrane-associated phospholipid phosphatase
MQVIWRKRVALGYGLFWVGWGVLAYFASTQSFLPGDLIVAQWVQPLIYPQTDAVTRGISAMGSTIAVILEVVVITTIFWLSGRKTDSVLIFLLPIITGLGSVVQILINRPRPSQGFLVYNSWLSSGSFPSGHVIWATSLATCLLSLVSSVSSKYVKITLWFFLLAYAFLTGISRIFLGAHYFSDVIGGYIFGFLLSIALILFHRQYLVPLLSKINIFKKVV